MGKQFRHLCQDIEGALRYWTPRSWRAVAKDNNTTPKEVKAYFQKCLDEGKRVLPLSKDCTGFDFIKGCPGHQESDS